MSVMYSKCVDSRDPLPFEQHPWRLWASGKSREFDHELMPQMVLHRWLRDRGGILESEGVLRVTVYLSEKTSNCQCRVIEFSISKRSLECSSSVST